jgi:hypothetical protein
VVTLAATNPALRRWRHQDAERINQPSE